MSLRWIERGRWGIVIDLIKCWSLPFDERSWLRKQLRCLCAVLPVLTAALLPPTGTSEAIAGEAATAGIGAEDGGADKTESYVARLREALPENWIEQEFRRQRSFPALARSRQLATSGKYDDAVEELANYLGSDPGDLVMQFEYLVLAANLKRYSAAISAADLILNRVPKFTPASYYRGLARAALGQNKDALTDLAAATSSHELAPEDIRYAQRSLALAALASPEPIDALAIVDRQAAKHGANPMLLIAKGQLMERLDRLADAAVAYDKAAELAGDPDDGRAALVLGAELALKRGDATGALARAQAAWKSNPGKAEVAVVLAEAASRLGRTDLVEAAERETKTAGTADRRTREVVANALYRLGRYDQAASRFGELAQTAGSPAEEYRLRLAAGFASQAAKDASRALSEFRRAAAINPEPEALSAVTEAALQAGRLDVAATELRRLVEASEGEDQRYALERLSVVEEKRNRFEDARAVLDRVPLELRDAEIERRSAALAAKSGNREAAVVYAVRLSGLEPTRTNLRALGEAQLAAGQTDAAVGSFERALKAAPEDDPNLREILANALASAGQPERAVQEFDALAARAKWPTDEYRLRLAGGFAALKSGDPARALTAFRQAEELDPSATKAPTPADEYRLRLAAGFAALKSGDASRALAAFRQAVEIEATRKSLEAAAESALQAGHLTEATGYLERLAAADRDSLASAPHLERLSVVYETIGRIRESAEALHRLPKAAQNKPEIIRREVVLAQKLGDRKGLLAHMRDLAAAEPSEENLAALADAQIGAGQGGAAVATLEGLLANRTLPEETKAAYLKRLGNVEASRGNWRRAQLLFVEAYRLSPAHPPELLAQAAESATQSRDSEQAIQYYRMLAGNERTSRKFRADYSARLGVALASLARDQEALAAYDTAVQLGGPTSALHENRGAVLMRLGRPVAAASEFRAAYDAHPRADLALSLGYAHQAAHQPGLAIVFLQRALAFPEALSPGQLRQARAALGYAYSETEQYHLAAECLERALGTPPLLTSSPGCGVRKETAAVQ
jgi:tetratricopeptide (TPR) repeat protein